MTTYFTKTVAILAATAFIGGSAYAQSGTGGVGSSGVNTTSGADIGTSGQAGTGIDGTAGVGADGDTERRPASVDTPTDTDSQIGWDREEEAGIEMDEDEDSINLQESGDGIEMEQSLPSQSPGTDPYNTPADPTAPETMND